ncbi:hypothetical protein [Streptomyces sp. AC627_RSS907]|uniref:hypothetical protein n=1 Tax=Streptomyces sp. AC627_RSS907 TaxID=2823684 RepID=UPI001C2714AF|nr:hypothetical protein [Streptomyces sp. AC627_RSS907]
MSELVKDAEAARKAVTALDTHYGFMKQAGGVAEGIRSNVEANYYTDSGSAEIFRQKFVAWQQGYTEAMRSVDDVWNKLNQQQQVLDAGEEAALQHAKSGFDSSAVSDGILDVLNRN